MKIAIIGSGISGLSAAYFLSKNHDILLFEQDEYIGGHSHTVRVAEENSFHDIDTGFIVCNKKTYPNFMCLLKILNVELQPTRMGLSIKSNEIEFSGNNINTIFSQRKNLFNIRFWNMLYEIYRFNRLAQKSLQDQQNETLDAFLRFHAISEETQKNYIIPIISAIWSAGENDVRNFPSRFLFQFLENHGLLSLNSAPLWYTIKGGSVKYVEKMANVLANKIILNTPVRKIIRSMGKVVLQLDGSEVTVDKVILAVHSDQVLALLDKPTNEELHLFGNLKYMPSSVILHTDRTVLAKNERAWASWNYWITDKSDHKPCVTYNMNILQGIKSRQTYCVSLNLDAHILEKSIIGKYNYSHPIYDNNLIEMQKLWHTVNKDETYYCGAYWRYGFHEDGLVSGLRVVREIDKEILCKMPFTLDL